MVLLHSEKTKLGSSAPEFKLTSVDGKTYSLQDFKGSKALLVMFICNHCPYVQAVEDRYISLSKEASAKGVQVVGICSNDPTDYPDDSPENLKKRWESKSYGFPYLVDESQDVARSFGVVCTPEFFLYDGNQKLVYHGQLDDNWKEPGKVTKHDLKDAIDALLSGGKPSENQMPSMGCSIKWKKGS